MSKENVEIVRAGCERFASTGKINAVIVMPDFVPAHARILDVLLDSAGVLEIDSP